MTPEDFRAKHPAWCLENGHHPWSTVRAEGETEEQALDELSAEIERQETKARHQEIGRLVEEIVRQMGLSDTLRLYPTVYHKDHSEVCAELVRTCDNVPDKSATDTLLDALRALAKEVSGE